MRIGGHGRIARRSKLVVVGRDDETGEAITLRVFEGGLGLADDIGDELRVPQPPRNGPPIMDERGRFKKTAQGAPLLEVNTADVGWLAAIKVIEHLRDVALVYHCLDRSTQPEDGQVAFEAVDSSFRTPAEFYKAVKSEMKAGGLSDAGFQALLEAIGDLSAITQEDIDKASEELATKDDQGNSSGPSSTGDFEHGRISESLTTNGQA